MANQFLYYYRNIAGNTDNVKFLYEFDSQPTGLVYDSKQSYSGTIANYVSSFYSASGSGGLNGTSYFTVSGTGIDPNQFTLFLDFQRKSASKGGIFSTATTGSGFTFGINDVNRFYIDVPQKKETHVFQTLYPAQYNTIALSKNRHSFSLYLLDPTNNSADSESWECDFSALPNNSGAIYVGRDNVNQWNYSGYFGQIAYVDRNLSKNIIYELFSGFKPETLSLTGYNGIFNFALVNDAYNSFNANEDASFTLVSKSIDGSMLNSAFQSRRVEHWTGTGDFSFSGTSAQGSMQVKNDAGTTMGLAFFGTSTSGATFPAHIDYEYLVDADKKKLVTHSTYTVSGKKVFVDHDYNIIITGGIPILDSTGWINAYKMDGLHFYPRKFLSGQFYDSSRHLLYSTGQSYVFNNEAPYSIVAGYYKTNDEKFSQVIVNENHKTGLYTVTNNNIIGPTGTNKKVHYSFKANYSPMVNALNVAFDGRVTKSFFRKFAFITGAKSGIGYQCFRNDEIFEHSIYDKIYNVDDFSAFSSRPYTMHNNTTDSFIS